MPQRSDRNPVLSIALPKGRLLEKILDFFSSRGIVPVFEDRKLMACEENHRYAFYKVKNSDLPTYVHHSITGLGICGRDKIYESGCSFYQLFTFPFGKTKMCLAGAPENKNYRQKRVLSVATSYNRFTKDFFLKQNIPLKIIKLNGSVELAPYMGLSDYIVDLVQTGSTLEANGLDIIEELASIDVVLISNPSYYKLHYKAIQTFLNHLRGDQE